MEPRLKVKNLQSKERRESLWLQRSHTTKTPSHLFLGGNPFSFLSNSTQRDSVRLKLLPVTSPATTLHLAVSFSTPHCYRGGRGEVLSVSWQERWRESFCPCWALTSAPWIGAAHDLPPTLNFRHITDPQPLLFWPIGSTSGG